MGERERYRARGVGYSEGRTRSAEGVDTTPIFEAMGDDSRTVFMIRTLFVYGGLYEKNSYLRDTSQVIS
jgi:hypothetical protein